MATQGEAAVSLRPNATDEGGGVQGQNIALRKQVDGRLLGLRVNRYSWWVHWRELADYLLPRRYKWLITPNQWSRGMQINQHILDSTATLAARNLASGMMSGITSPTRPWFRLKIGHIDSTQTSPTSLWLAECERLMMLVFQESNFYNAMAVFYLDLVIFGTAVMLIYEDFENVIKCFNPCAGEYYIDNDNNYQVRVFYREFTMTVDQVVSEFGLDNVSPSVKSTYETGQAALTREIIVAHAIESNQDGRKYGIPEQFKFREVYWEWNQSQTYILRKKGYLDWLAICSRWDLVSNDAYGRSPGMDALPDVKQLQQETKRKAQAIDKHVNPPMLADVQLKNQPASMLPGGVTYVTGLASGKVGFAPVYQVQPVLNWMMEDIKEIQQRIKDTFFMPIFQAITQLEGDRRSATEIDARRSEQLVFLGPVLERIYNEGIKPTIERTFGICVRANVFPEPPQEIAGHEIQIEFVSMLSQAQSAASSSGIERLLGLAGSLVGVDPAVMDNIDIDFALDKYSDNLNNDPRLIRSPEDLASIRAKREQEKQQAQALQATEGLAKAGKTLSETQLGAGKNALQQMTGL